MAGQSSPVGSNKYGTGSVVEVEGAPARPQIQFLLNRKRLVIAVWACLFVASGPFVLPFLNSVSMTILPPANSQTGRARSLLMRDLPSLMDSVPEVVLISCDSCTSVMRDPFVNGTLHKLSDHLDALDRLHPGFLVSWDAPTAAADLEEKLRKLPIAAAGPTNPYLEASGKMVVFTTMWKRSAGAESESTENALIRDLVNLIGNLDRIGQSSGYHLQITGEYSIQNAVMDSIKTETMLKELLISPLAIAVLWYQVRSWRLSLLCAAGMLLSGVVSFGTFYAISQNADVPILPVTPCIMAVLCLALSVDYSLFLMTRLKEEICKGKGPDEALVIALDTSGCVIALSGTILCLCYLAASSLPELLRNISMACSWEIAIVVLVSLTFTPCMIASFPRFFLAGLKSGGLSRGSRAWFRWGTLTTDKPWVFAVPIIAYLCMAPFIWNLKAYESRGDMSLVLPRGSDGMHSYFHMTEVLPNGLMLPMYMHSSAERTVKSNAFFEGDCNTIRKLVGSTAGEGYALRPQDFVSLVLVPSAITDALRGMCPPLVCLRWSESPPECPVLPSAKQLLIGYTNPALSTGFDFDSMYQKLWSQLSSIDNTSAATLISPSFEQHAEIRGFSAALYASAPEQKVTFLSEALVQHELSEEVDKQLPRLCVMMAVVIFTLVTATFRVAIVPLKLFATVFLPIAAVYGILISVHQQGALDWMNWPPLQSGAGVSWLIPAVSVVPMFGLAVDYDLFLFARVLEARSEGYQNRAAVVGALAMTGPVITAAGIIMATAFFGLVLSSVRMDSQLGFVMCAGILIDTFVIRSALVPSMLTLGGGWLNYWPLELPEEVRSLEDMHEYVCGEDDSIKQRLKSVPRSLEQGLVTITV